MKNNYWFIIYFLLIFICSDSLISQGINSAKMDKDLEVAENVLHTILEQSLNNRFLRKFGDNIESTYKKGYGVVLQINNNIFRGVIGRAVVLGAKTQGFTTGFPGKKQNDHRVVIGTNIAQDNIEKEEKPDLKEVLKNYLMDYHHLIRQLDADNHIMIKTGERSGPYDLKWGYTTGIQTRHNDDFSLEAKVKDLQEYAKGSINKKEMENRIIEKNISGISKKEPQIEIFSAALGRMYQSDLSQSYYITNYPWFERMEGFGVTYYFRFYSSVIIDDRYNLPTFSKDNLTLEERNKVVVDAYPSFKQNLKENMLDYGHLLSSLDNEENLVFNVILTECKGCGIPSELELEVKKSVIDEYRNGKISLENAIKKVDEHVIR